MSTGLTGGGRAARSPLAVAAAVASLILAVLACYLPTQGDYWISYDNPRMIQQEPRTRALTLDGSARAAALMSLATTPHRDLYQPLASLSWAIDYALFGWDRAGFHAHSLALHVLVVVALFFLALRLSESVLAAFLAALLCGVHPVMVQSVCWTVSRTSSLAAIWILIGSHLHLSYAKQPGKHHLLALSTLAFAISLLAKSLPSVVLVPLFVDLWVGRPLRLRVWLSWLPLAVTAGILALVNLQNSTSIATQASIVRPWLEVLQSAPESLALATANVVWPRSLALHYDFQLGGSLIGWRWLGVAGAGVFAGVGGVALWRRGERGVLLSAAAFLGLLAPQIAAIRFRDILTADRYVYIPLLFLALGAASLLTQLLGDRVQRQSLRHRGTLALTCLAAVALGIETRAGSRMWADEEQLWQRVISQTPAPLPYSALCRLYAKEGRSTDAVEACTQAQALAMQDRYASKDPSYAFDLAVKARAAGEEWKTSGRADAPRTAARYFELASSSTLQAIARWPDRIDLRYELARSQLASGDARRAISTFEALLAIDPNDDPAITYLAVALFEVGDLDRARELLEANPSAGMVEPIRYATLARIYTEQGRHDLATRANLAWVEADPEEEAAHAAFQASLRAAGEANQAERLDELREYYRARHAEQSNGE